MCRAKGAIESLVCAESSRKGHALSVREQLIALHDADCTTVGGKFDFRETLADRAEQTMGPLGSNVLHAVGIRLQKGNSLIIDDAGGRLRLQVKRIGTGEAHFHQASAALHGIETGADEVSIEKNISRRGHQVDVIQLGLKYLRVSADGAEIELAGALSTDKRSAGGLDNNVAGNFLEMNVACIAF